MSALCRLHMKRALYYCKYYSFTALFAIWITYFLICFAFATCITERKSKMFICLTLYCIPLLKYQLRKQLGIIKSKNYVYVIGEFETEW